MVRQISPFSALFRPSQFNGDFEATLYLWRAMARALRSRPFPETGDKLDALLEGEFERLTGNKLLEELAQLRVGATPPTLSEARR
jgi:hypothetical protein